MLYADAALSPELPTFNTSPANILEITPSTEHRLIQPDQINMAVFFWYLVKGVGYCTRLHLASLFM